MIEFIPENLKKLAEQRPYPVYVVGGSVRDFLAGYARAQADFSDWDICAPVRPGIFAADAEKSGFKILSEYKNTGTVKLSDASETGYEFSSFRSDEYVRGSHVPARIYFTEDIASDAKRRDFTCNAVYFDIKKNCFCDPLGGAEDIKRRIIRTVRDSRKVFGEDGLRLMRLARQCGQLGFVPDEETLSGAKEHAFLIRDIAPERIFTELNTILHADEKYGVKDGHYRALKILEQTGVLDEILPELCEGRGMKQPPAFHDYDVLEHSLRCVLYAPPAVRWAALLHDAGKPYCMRRDGNYHRHHTEGAALSDEILTRLKAPKRLKEYVHALVLQHMYDMENAARERKLRRYLVENYSVLPDLIALKQADYSACKDDLSACPAKIRWETLLNRMRREGVPFTQKELKISGKDLLEAGIPPSYVGKTLHGLFMRCAAEPQDNEKEKLLKIARGIYNNLRLNH